MESKGSILTKNEKVVYHQKRTNELYAVVIFSIFDSPFFSKKNTSYRTTNNLLHKLFLKIPLKSCKRQYFALHLWCGGGGGEAHNTHHPSLPPPPLTIRLQACHRTSSIKNCSNGRHNPLYIRLYVVKQLSPQQGLIFLKLFHIPGLRDKNGCHPGKSRDPGI